MYYHYTNPAYVYIELVEMCRGAESVTTLASSPLGSVATPPRGAACWRHIAPAFDSRREQINLLAPKCAAGQNRTAIRCSSGTCFTTKLPRQIFKLLCRRGRDRTFDLFITAPRTKICELCACMDSNHGPHQYSVFGARSRIRTWDLVIISDAL